MEISPYRLIGRPAMPPEPGTKRGEAWVFNRPRHNAGRKDRTALSQEADEPARPTPTVCRPCAFHQHAALATDRTAAIMLGETVNYDLVHIAPSDARQTKPACKMLGFRTVPALALKAVPHALEMVRERGEMRGNAFEVIDN